MIAGSYKCDEYEMTHLRYRNDDDDDDESRKYHLRVTEEHTCGELNKLYRSLITEKLL